MSQYKGLVRFISDTKELALVEETTLVQSQDITSTGIGTGDGSEVEFSGTLQPIIDEGSLTIKVAGTSTTITEFNLTTSTGLKCVTSTGMGVITTDGIVHTSSGTWTPASTFVIRGTDLEPGKQNLVDKVDGRIIVTFTSAATPTLGQEVTVSYSHDYSNSTIGFDRIRLLRGDFSTVAVDDVIYYDYTNGTSEDFAITETRPGA